MADTVSIQRLDGQESQVNKERISDEERSGRMVSLISSEAESKSGYEVF